MIVVRTTLRLASDARETAVSYIEPLVDRSREDEPGTLRYDAAASLIDPAVIHFFEVYEDVEAADAHAHSDDYRAFVESLPEIVLEPIETVQFETESRTVSEFSAADAVAALE